MSDESGSGAGAPGPRVAPGPRDALGPREALGPRDALELASWRRAIAELYAGVRAAPSAQAGWARWREVRDALFLTHPQSPLPAERRHAGFLPSYFDHDAALRVLAALETAEPERLLLPSSRDEPMGATRVATARFSLAGRACSLPVFWLDGYAGGLFVSFLDATSGSETYGGGRYLLDTVKGADLGVDGEMLVLDFNFAYQPSCAYDPAWACPLPPRDSRLPIAIRAGERSREI